MKHLYYTCDFLGCEETPDPACAVVLPLPEGSPVKELEVHFCARHAAKTIQGMVTGMARPALQSFARQFLEAEVGAALKDK